jgi:hypothetical protein
MRCPAVKKFSKGADLYGGKPYIIDPSGELPMPQQQARTTRIEARIAPDALAVVKRAAEIQGRNVYQAADVVVFAAINRARCFAIQDVGKIGKAVLRGCVLSSTADSSDNPVHEFIWMPQSDRRYAAVVVRPPLVPSRLSK